MIQIQKILHAYDVGIFTIMEANLSDDKLKYYQFPGYTLYLLPKYRHVASGILTGVKEGLTSHYDLIKSMGSTQNMCEIIRLNAWKCQKHFKIYAVYNPSHNSPSFDFLNISHKTVVLGDFNAHFTRLGYKNINLAGKEIEDMPNSDILELIYSIKILLHICTTMKPEQLLTCSWLQPTSASSDLLLASTDISEHTYHKITDDPGSDHKPVIASVVLTIATSLLVLPSAAKAYQRRKIKTILVLVTNQSLLVWF
ncbi:unnamed protein product [Rodentolepis nana]|uniref:Endo/exonuclease/phosphatase domain-containing protein n=1 Tax=Rodentolepis nana TaxID=102285 RepID=A0A0R3TFY2_RODNA|nr:unnamed protein product [Rodentolepis nana]